MSYIEALHALLCIMAFLHKLSQTVQQMQPAHGSRVQEDDADVDSYIDQQVKCVFSWSFGKLK